MDSLVLQDDDVNQLYRCLLGRAPENADTIAAFRAYYPDFGQGRLAVLGSEEFRRLYRENFGLDPFFQADPLAVFTRLMLARAPPRPHMPGNSAFSQTLADIFARQQTIRFAVMLGGDASGLDLDTLAPLGAEATLLVLENPGEKPAISKTAGCGTHVIRVAMTLAELDEILRAQDLKIDVLYGLNEADPDAAARYLIPHLAGRALVILGSAGLELHKLIAGCRDDAPFFTLGEFTVFSLGGWCLQVQYAPPAGPKLFTDLRHAPALALAAIMRNEQNAVPNMLRSVLPLIQYCALVDTGSTDRTIAAAREVLEESGIEYKIIEIARGRFDDMRNAALNLVPPWVAWVLMLDADEEIVPEDYGLFLRLLRDDQAACHALPRYNFMAPEKEGETIPYPDRQIRLLRNRRGSPIRYSGVVHETVRDVEAAFPPLDASHVGGGRGGPHIHHLVRRFRTPAEEAAKQDFYRDLAQAVSG